MSMGNELVAKRYAVALFELVQEKDTVAQAEKDIALVQEIFRNEQLNDFLANPKVTIDQKKAVIGEQLSSNVSQEILNTIFLMIDRKRGDSIAEMANQFLALVLEEQNVAEAVIYSVAPLNEEQQQSVSSIIAKKVGKDQLRLKNVIQPELIGGIRIRVGNQIFDGSVSRKLQSLKRELTASNV